MTSDRCDEDPAAQVSPATPPTDPAVVTATGPVSAGVECGSVVLCCDDGTVYQLGRAYAHLVGQRVTVTGRVRTDIMTIAQQGVVLHVDTVAPDA